MKNISKKILTTITILFITSVYSFAQLQANMETMIKSLDMSAKKRATAGEFSSDSDKLNAKNVFDLNRTIFSAGYVPNLNSSSNQVIQAFFGIPLLNNTMYFGFAGAYAMSETRADYVNNETAIANSPNYLGKKVTNASSFAIRPVLKINDMVSIHYMIARGGTKSTIKGYSYFTNDINYSVMTNSTANTDWVHEIAVGLMFGDMKLNIPIAVYIENNNYTKNYSKTISGNFINETNYSNTETIAGSTNGGYSPISLVLSPEFSMPLVSGPMTGITVGLVLGFDVYNPYKKTTSYANTITDSITSTSTASTTNRTTDNKSTVVTEDKMFGMDFDINFYPTLQWSLSDNRVQLIMEPKVGVKLNVSNRGNRTTTYKVDGNTYDGATDTPNSSENATISQNKISTVTTTPYVSLPIGTVLRPVNWFEFRAGLSYSLGFEMKNISTEYLAGGKSKKFSYDFKSSMELFTGIGFIIGEDFFIDLFLAAGTRFASSTTTAGKTIFDIDAWGAQLSYRL